MLENINMYINTNHKSNIEKSKKSINGKCLKNTINKKLLT